MVIQEKTARAGNFAADQKRAPDGIRYLVIHDTDSDRDTARFNACYFSREATGVSVHYFVDADEIWRSVPDAFTAWHCGTRGVYYHAQCRNHNSIGIALCSCKDSRGQYSFAPTTIKRAAVLVEKLMEQYNIPAGRVLRHYDVTHKTCPEPFVRDAFAWKSFKNQLQEKQNGACVFAKEKAL